VSPGGPTTTAPAIDEAYRRARARLVGLLSAETSAVDLPSCPGWTVRDVVAHVTGVAEAWVRADLDGYATSGWTAAQIERRAGRSLDTVVDEWASLLDVLLPVMRSPESFHHPAFMPHVVLGDLGAHEHDVREALGAPVPGDVEAVELVLGGAMHRLERKLAKAGAPSLEVRPDGRPGRRIGQGEVLASVAGEPYELWRSLVGRRTRRRVEAFRWEGDSRPFVDAWLEFPFVWPGADVVV
jgi:uncharacterized protein (TIGR03083 family)